MKRLLLSVAIAACLPLACNKDNAANGNGTAGSASAVASASAPLAAGSTSSSASANAMKPRRHYMAPRGAAGLLFHEADVVQGLDVDQQKKIDALEDSLAESAPREELRAYTDEASAEIKAGKIDEAKLGEKRAAADKAIKAHHDKEADAVNELHKILKPEQRKAIVEKARAVQTARAAHLAKMKEAEKSAAPNAPDPMVAHMAKDLDLDAAQQKKVEAIVPKDKPDFEAMKKRDDALFDAFEKDDFDAKKTDAYKEDPAKQLGGMGAMDPKFLSQLVAILKPEQREKMAARMARVMGGPGMGPGGGMGGPGHMGGPGMMGGPGHMGGPGGMMGAPHPMGSGSGAPDDDTP